MFKRFDTCRFCGAPKKCVGDDCVEYECGSIVVETAEGPKWNDPDECKRQLHNSIMTSKAYLKDGAVPVFSDEKPDKIIVTINESSDHTCVRFIITIGSNTRKTALLSLANADIPELLYGALREAPFLCLRSRKTLRNYINKCIHEQFVDFQAFELPIIEPPAYFRDIYDFRRKLKKGKFFELTYVVVDNVKDL